MEVFLKTYIMGLMTSCIIMTACQSDNPRAPRGDFEIVKSEAINWQPIPNGLGAKYAVLYGDPTQIGTYVIRVHFPAGIMDLPHSHSGDRHVTVIKGEWMVGTGLSFDPLKAKTLSAGSYMFHPADGVHWDGAAGDEDAIVQIIGNGPVTTEQNHDEAHNWVNVN